MKTKEATDKEVSDDEKVQITEEVLYDDRFWSAEYAESRALQVEDTEACELVLDAARAFDSLVRFDVYRAQGEITVNLRFKARGVTEEMAHFFEARGWKVWTTFYDEEIECVSIDLKK